MEEIFKKEQEEKVKLEEEKEFFQEKNIKIENNAENQIQNPFSQTVNGNLMILLLHLRTMPFIYWQMMKYNLLRNLTSLANN